MASDSNIYGDNLFTVSLKTDQQIEDNYLSEPDNEDQLKQESCGDNPSNHGTENEKINRITQSTIENNLITNTNTNKTLSERLFSRIDAGSLRGSIFNLAILSLGSACLALPQKFGQMSIIVAMIDIVLAGLACYWTLNIMILASETTKIYNYSHLVQALYGKGLSMFLDITMLLYIGGVMILYQVIGTYILKLS